jgi:hypothetical protein
MNDNTREPFRCPVQECHDEQGSAFGDAKRFYLHWFATHKPRCPRTDCKYSLQDLSKTTESYFLRHWATHFPELKPEQSACAKCGQHFANANNRDRHAIKCVSGTSGDDQVVAEEIGRRDDMHATSDAVGAIAPDFGPFDWSGLVCDQEPSDTNLLDGEHLFLNEFAVPLVCMGEPTSMATVTTPMSTTVSTMDLFYGYTTSGQSSAFSLPHDPFSLPIQWPRVTELEEESANNFSGSRLNQMFDTNMLEATPGADAIAPSSRKRRFEGETTQRKRKCPAVMTDADHLVASFDLSDTHPGADNPGELRLSRGMTDGTVSGRLLLRTRKQYTERTWTRTVSKQQSRQVCRSRQLIAVKSFVQTATGHQQVSYDHHTWVHKLVHGARRTTDTITILVNNVLVSKKTRFPRVRGSKPLHPIDLHTIMIEALLTHYR